MKIGRVFVENSRDKAAVKSCGKLFQACGADTENERLSSVAFETSDIRLVRMWC